VRAASYGACLSLGSQAFDLVCFDFSTFQLLNTLIFDRNSRLFNLTFQALKPDWSGDVRGQG